MSGWAGFWIGLGIAIAAHFLSSSAETIAEEVVDYLKWKEKR